MELVKISCPECGAWFETDPDYRGEETDCPKCGTSFEIPFSGSVGVRVSQASSAETDPADGGTEAIQSSCEIGCPACGVTFEVPEDYRGEQAECSECGAVFLIPETGAVGVKSDHQPEVSPAAVEPALSEALPPVEPAAANVTASGIQQTSVSASQKKSGTVRLSRSAVLANTMRPQLKPEPSRSSTPLPEMKPTREAAPASSPSRLATMSSNFVIPPSVASRAQVEAVPKPPEKTTSPIQTSSAPAPVRAKHAVMVPDWAGHVKLNQGEEILSCKVADTRTVVARLLISLIPVLLIPLAVIFSGVIGAIMSALLFQVIGAAIWTIFATMVLPSLRRKALIVTTQRAIMVQDIEVLEVELDY